MNIEIKRKIENLNELEKEYRNHKNNFENKLSLMRSVQESKEIGLKNLKKTAWGFSISILICFAGCISSIYINLSC